MRDLISNLVSAAEGACSIRYCKEGGLPGLPGLPGWFMSLSTLECDLIFTQPHLCTVQGAVAAIAIGDIARADCKDARVALIQHLAMPDMPWWKICRICSYATVIRIHRICCTTGILQNTTTKRNTSST